jgi:hypothetical protein
VNGVSEDVVPRLGRRNVARRPADHDAEFHLPVGLVTALGEDDFLVVADDAATGRLVEQVRDAAVRHPFRPSGGPFLGGARLTGMTEEVDGGVQHLARIPEWRKESDIARVVDVGRPPGGRELPSAHHVIDDLIDPVLQPVLVLAYQIDHVVRDRDHREVPGHLQVPVGAVELDDELFAKYQCDRFPSGDVHRCQVERLDGSSGLCGARRWQPQ